MQLIRAARPRAERIAAAQQYRREADAYFDRAVHLAPEEAEVYRRRGGSHYCYGFLDSCLRSYKGEKVDSAEFYLGREVEKALPDLRRAVELDRQEYKGIGFVALMETMVDIRDRYLRNPSAKPPEKLMDAVSQPTRKHLLEDMARLEKGVQNPNKNKASEAAEVLGFLQLLLFADYSAAEKSARRSIELGPDREAAWDLLEQSLVAAKDARKWVNVCRERLEHKDSPRNRLMMAKAYEYPDQLDKAEEVVRAGLQREPDDFMLRLALVDLLIMHGDKKSLREARKLLYKMHEDKLSDDGGENRWTNYAFTCGIYCGLLGDREKALKWLKVVQKRQPQYSGLEDALKALED